MTFNCSKTAVTVVIAHFLCSVHTLKCHEHCIKIARRDSKTWSQIVHLVRNSTPKRFFRFEARILRIGHFFGWEWKFSKSRLDVLNIPSKLFFAYWTSNMCFQQKFQCRKKWPNGSRPFFKFSFLKMFIRDPILQHISYRYHHTF